MSAWFCFRPYWHCSPLDSIISIFSLIFR